MNITQKTFLVSGGASGLGAGVARLIVESGGQVVIADLNEAIGQTLVAELGSKSCFIKTDVTDEISVQQAIDLAVNRFGELWGVVNCAGVALVERVLGKNYPHDYDNFAEIIAINLTGTFNLIRLAAAVMSKNKPLPSAERGVIVNTASVIAFDGLIGHAAYAASKGGVVSMTLPIARELAHYGIRVMTIAPGFFDTPMITISPSLIQSVLEQVPFPNRLGQPSEFAALVKHIIENEMLNGEVIRLDGAIRLGVKR